MVKPDNPLVTMKQTVSNIKAVLLDIEGTMCPISFVKEILFPYALNALPSVLATKWDDPDFQQYRAAFPSDARASSETFEAHARNLTERDVKVAYLKNLQGYLWQEGYESGAYTSPFFDDVVPALERWEAAGLEISIYSSGSVFAQRLLFGHVKDVESDDPKATVDLKGVITAWFDTVNAGPKTDKESYEKIAEELGKEPGELLFLSDAVKEVKAAEVAGLRALLVERPGNAELTEEDKKRFDAITTFADIKIAGEHKEEAGPGKGSENRKRPAEDTAGYPESTMKKRPKGRPCGSAKQEKRETSAVTHNVRRSQRLQISRD